MWEWRNFLSGLILTSTWIVLKRPFALFPIRIISLLISIVIMKRNWGWVYICREVKNAKVEKLLTFLINTWFREKSLQCTLKYKKCTKLVHIKIDLSDWISLWKRRGSHSALTFTVLFLHVLNQNTLSDCRRIEVWKVKEERRERWSLLLWLESEKMMLSTLIEWYEQSMQSFRIRDIWYWRIFIIHIHLLLTFFLYLSMETRLDWIAESRVLSEASSRTSEFTPSRKAAIHSDTEC